MLRIEILVALTITAIIWLGAHEVQLGTLTPGDLVLFMSYATGLYRPLEQLAGRPTSSGKPLRRVTGYGRSWSKPRRSPIGRTRISAPALRGQPRLRGRVDHDAQSHAWGAQARALGHQLRGGGGRAGGDSGRQRGREVDIAPRGASLRGSG